MTGTQYWQLSEGDICILTEDLDLYHWKKGDKIVVVYRDRFEGSVYVCNTSFCEDEIYSSKGELINNLKVCIHKLDQ